MAALSMALLVRQRLSAVTSVASRLLLNPSSNPIACSPSIEQSRCASKKAGGATRNRKGRAKPKFRHYRIQHGEFVHEGDVIATQYGLRWYPGENVNIDDRLTLTAAYDGILVHSTEELSPYPNSPLYTPVENGLSIKKRFFHVIPTPLHGKFRLVSQT